MNYKQDFPIFENNPELIYFDSGASSQKPKIVIDAIKNYLENTYSNIHRWAYDLAIDSEKLYKNSKKAVATNIWAFNYKEIIYTYNSTYALNLLVSSLKRSNFFQKWDKILLSITEHHANLIPWLILKEETWIEIDYIWIDENFYLDLKDFEKKYDENVKIISLTQVSNVTWQIFDLEEIWKRKREDTLFIVDASQSIPHLEVDVNKINADFLFFTWHKVFADSWIWVLWGKKELLEKIKPAFSWGWAISSVSCENFSDAQIPDKFEAWTPNISGAISLLYAFKYIKNIWWIEKIKDYEEKLVKYFLDKLKNYKNIELIWNKNPKNRIWVFSLVFDWYHSHDIAEIMAENSIALRAWKHCAHPLFIKLWVSNSLRVSLYIYNDFSDIDKFFEVIDGIEK